MAQPSICLANLFDGQVPLRPEWQEVFISGLTSDSREVEPGFLFAALSGTNEDGAAYVPQAVERGAAAVLTGPDTDMAGFEVPVVRDDEPRHGLALAASKFFGQQPDVCVAITGTNGKTSVASFIEQIWRMSGLQSASIGTLGVTGASYEGKIIHTTPDPVTLHHALASVARSGTTHLALETSSHGLAQHRVDGVKFRAGAFTNISRDHLDYHGSFEDYLNQKLRLFSDVLQPGAHGIVFADTPEAPRVIDVARARGLKTMTVGEHGEDLTLTDSRREGLGQAIVVHQGKHRFECAVPLVGGFQVSNVLVAMGLAMATGLEMPDIIEYVGRLSGPCGRLELVGRSRTGGAVFVDFAHTPDALANALQAVRPYVTGRLIVAFGCGGDRDRGKRPQMGTIAARDADLVIVTDDNPRTEDPAFVRSEIMVATPDALEIGDRAKAIHEGVAMMTDGDVLLIAGKGHETGQTIGTQTVPFSDQSVAREALGEGVSDVG